MYPWKRAFDAAGVASAEHLLAVLTVGGLRGLVRSGEVIRIWHGAYALRPPTTAVRLHGLGVALGTEVTGCLGTAAELFGFDTENTTVLHVVEPADRHLRCRPGLRVHQRVGAPTVRHGTALLTSPAWTAVEVARMLKPPRALATLDAALGTGLCTREDLRDAVRRQAGRRGIVMVRRLIEIADGRAGSPMESETRLLIVDDGLPVPDLQHPVLGDDGRPRFYLDLAWPRRKVAVEYDGDEHHSTPVSVRRDKLRAGWLGDEGWTVLPVVADDVRRHPEVFLARLRRKLGLSGA